MDWSVWRAILKLLYVVNKSDPIVFMKLKELSLKYKFYFNFQISFYIRTRVILPTPPPTYFYLPWHLLTPHPLLPRGKGSWGVIKVWHSKLEQDQDPPPCIKS